MKVILKSTDFKDDQIVMTGTSAGGYSHFAVQDPINSRMMNNVITLGGVGNFSATHLRKALAGKTASARPSVTLTTQDFNGSSSIKDFETMLQLVYLYFTAPRSGRQLPVVPATHRDAIEEPGGRPDIASATQSQNRSTKPADKVGQGGGSCKDRLQTDCWNIRELFRNPGSFVFTFVGTTMNTSNGDRTIPCIASR